MKNIQFIIVGLFVVCTISLLNCIRDKSLGPNGEPFSLENQMIVYPNSGNTFYWVNYNTLELERTTKLNIPDTIGCFGMCLSTNKDYLIFPGQTLSPPFTQYIISYDIKGDSIYNIFSTGLDSVGAPKLSAAELPDNQGLLYLYSHSVGMYTINFFNQETNLISDTHSQSLGKYFYSFYENNSIAILVQHGSEPVYSEIEIYNGQIGSGNYQYILNSNNQDGIQIDDLSLSKEEHIIISIRLPEKRKIANYFGSYTIETKKIYKSDIILPWSLNPYYLDVSDKRNEAYTVGAKDTLYIIDTEKEQYQIKAKIRLPGKLSGPSRVVLDPNENNCFISCADSGLLFVINLETQKVIKTIQMERPYLMILI